MNLYYLQAHIYASKLIDAKGASVWVDSSLENGLLTVYLDSKFLETAVFPVVVDPVFGYTNIGVSTVALGFNYKPYYFRVLLTDSYADVNKLSVYANYTSSVNVTCALYSGNATSAIDYIATSSEVNYNTAQQWQNHSLTALQLTSGYYWVAVHFDVGVTLYVDSGGNAEGYNNPVKTYPEFDNIASGFTSWNTYNPSIFLTYDLNEPTPTPTPSPSPSPSPSATPVVNGDLTDTEWFVSAMILVLVVVNIVLLAFPFALVRFVFGTLSLALSAIAFGFGDVPLAPYLQIMGLVVSVVCMFLATRARE